ncbi:MAG: hypothetical protein LBB57_00140 [Clostridiales Family XIII bacterium]|jgi:hypothetical protein|nr:hypothetical protein [Clostridiales Family XIII bacterium]
MKNTFHFGLSDCRSNRLRASALCAVLAAVLLAAVGLPAAVFAAEDGVYLAATNTYYLNPDTGVTDDGGSKNAAIGEGMCRSVIYEKALVEIEGGKVYVTVRVQLVSNMGAIKFTVQQKAGDPASYASASPRVIAEDAGADTADYRFSVPAVGSYIGCSTYVTPMVRDVKFYMNLSGNLTAGSGDFVVSLKPSAANAQSGAAAGAEAAGANEAAAGAEAEAAGANEAPAATPVPAEDRSPQADTPPAEATDANAAPEGGAEPDEALPGEAATGDGNAGAADENGAEAAQEIAEADGSDAEAETPGDTSARDGTAADAGGTPAQTAGDETTGAGDAEAKGADAAGGFPVLPAIIIAAVVIAGAVTAIMRKRKK